MKKSISNIFRLLTGAALVTLACSSCKDDNNTGIGILPGNDLITVKNVEIKDDISAYTFSESDLVTSRNSNKLLGSFNDPSFGNTTADVAAQFRITSYPTFGTNPVADSVRLYIYYRNIYGDTLTEQHFNVYELESPLNAGQEYKQDVDLKSMASTQQIGEIDYFPKVKLDSTSKDTTFQLITIPLENSLGTKLLTADSLDLINNDAFNNYFKGLYIESESVGSDEGALLATELIGNSKFKGSALVVYYNNDENKAKEQDEEQQPDTLSQSYLITQYSAVVNSFKHDYTGKAFVDNLNTENVEEDLVFIQPTGGLKARITIDNLSSWKDSVNTAINKAELVFPMDSVATNIERYEAPPQLILTYVDKDGKERLPIDYSFNPTYYGGYLHKDRTYRFNLTQHLQRIIDITDQSDSLYVGNQGFFLTTGQRSDFANRVILKGSNRENGMQLQITYTKYIPE